jgi:hypothetical protein
MVIYTRFDGYADPTVSGPLERVIGNLLACLSGERANMGAAIKLLPTLHVKIPWNLVWKVDVSGGARTEPCGAPRVAEACQNLHSSTSEL